MTRKLVINISYGIAIAMSGSLTNIQEAYTLLKTKSRRQANPSLDSDILLNIFADELSNQTNKAVCASCYVD